MFSAFSRLPIRITFHAAKHRNAKDLADKVEGQTPEALSRASYLLRLAGSSGGSGHLFWDSLPRLTPLALSDTS